MLNPHSALTIRADVYCKSTFFYSILNGNQEFTQIMIEYLFSNKPVKNKHLEKSKYSIINDFRLNK